MHWEKKILDKYIVHIIIFSSLKESTEQRYLNAYEKQELEYKHPTHTSDVISLHQCTNTLYARETKTDQHNAVLCYWILKENGTGESDVNDSLPANHDTKPKHTCVCICRQEIKIIWTIITGQHV